MLKLNFTHLGCMIFFSIQLLGQCLDITGVIPAQEIVPKSTLLAQKSSKIYRPRVVQKKMKGIYWQYWELM